MLIPDSKYILTISLLRHTPAEYRRLRQKELDRYCPAGSDVRQQAERQLKQNGSYPEPQIYHDIAGHVELYWNRNRILGTFFMKADKRTRYGKELSHNGSGIDPKSSNFHLHASDHELGRCTTPRPRAKDKQRVLLDAFDQVEKMAKDWNVFCDTRHHRELVECLDVDKFLPTRNQ